MKPCALVMWLRATASGAPPESSFRAMHDAELAGCGDRKGIGAIAIVTVPAEDPFAANAVAAGDHVLAAADSPRTHAALRAAGYRVIPVATPEMRKADGALTCLSIVLP